MIKEDVINKLVVELPPTVKQQKSVTDYVYNLEANSPIDGYFFTVDRFRLFELGVVFGGEVEVLETLEGKRRRYNSRNLTEPMLTSVNWWHFAVLVYRL